MVSDEEALRLDRAEKRARRVRAIRTWLLVVVLLAAAIGAMSAWLSPGRGYSEPWCVWATSTGGLVTVSSGGRTTITVPTCGDVRLAPGGRSAPGTWGASASLRFAGTPQQTAIPALFRYGGSSFWFLQRRGGWMPWFDGTTVQRTSEDGKVWTAFLLRSLPPDREILPTPDPACAGTWEFTDDEGATVPPVRLELLADGGVRESGPTDADVIRSRGRCRAGKDSAWLARDGVLVVRLRNDSGSADSAALPSSQFVGVLGDDLRSITGSRDGVQPMHGTRVDR